MTIPCPRCHGVRRKIREIDPATGKPSKNGRVIGIEEKTRDPKHPSKECIRCDGWGLVPPEGI